MKFSFLLKCIAGVALFAILLALLSKPALIVAAATAGLAATATAGLFMPIIPIMAAALLIAALCTVPVVAYRGPRPAGSGFYTYNPFVPAFWYGPSFATYSWLDYWNRPLYSGNTIHTRNGGGLFGGGVVHGHNTTSAGAGTLRTGTAHTHQNSLFSGHRTAHTNTANHHMPTHNAGHSLFGGGHTMFSGHSSGHSGFSGGHHSSSHHSFSAPSFGHGGSHHR